MKYLKVMFAILALISGSRTAALGIVFCILLELICSKNLFRKLLSYKKIFFIFVISMVFAIICICKFEIVSSIFQRVNELFGTLNKLSTESSGSVHLFYLTSVLDITQRNSIVNNLFGYGMGCSGYPFSHFFGQYISSEKWTVECDYINILWSYGYIGFIAYYWWYIKNILRSRRVSYKYSILFITFLFMGLFYNITFNWVKLLMIFIFAAVNNNINIFEDA